VIAVNTLQTTPATSATIGVTPVSTPNWRTRLPELRAGGVTLRELRSSDAASLHSALTATEVSRFISPPPNTVAGFERFIAWTQAERVAGRYVCFAIVPEGTDSAIGIFQIRQLGSSFDVAEWGFALAQPFWGSGIFAAAAPAVVGFAIETLKVHRLEARSAVGNGRGNGALLKIGAMREAVLRKSFLKDGMYHDQVLWAIMAHEWRLMHQPLAGRTH
jgi:ribosomal-protein-alanine N-acetyltransferase